MQQLIIFHGHVQGVGFRYTTRQLARRFPVTGYVKNLPDGTVELFIDGDQDDLEQLVTAIQGRFERNFTRTEVTKQDTKEHYTSFDIRR
ncbi:Acylphosphatase [Polystyrenella longa]|uniref:acylphosphatase n=1 Tax=Polystyrenella longa TaxID=2528007 RepID=A0A518CPV1_9PLAN|nr:acylphosphatase [Polystyrenella longa]QDU81224.1 Acylphosphatase [Polystyrenella longa]